MLFSPANIARNPLSPPDDRIRGYLAGLNTNPIVPPQQPQTPPPPPINQSPVRLQDSARIGTALALNRYQNTLSGLGNNGQPTLNPIQSTWKSQLNQMPQPKTPPPTPMQSQGFVNTAQGKWGGGSGDGNPIVSAARNYVGQNNYKYGVWDCSKFTQKVAKAAGMNIGGSTATQMDFFQRAGRWIQDISQAQPGDMLYFGSSASPSGRHTGVYIGNGMMIDNAGRGKPIAARKIGKRRLLGIGRMSA